MEERTRELESLFEETGRRHHQAFLEADGADPEWAAWYADDLLDRLPDLLTTVPPRSELIDLLEHLSDEQPRTAPEEPWSRYYATRFAERYG